MKRSIVEERTILLGIVGSQAYGLNTPTSDIDIKGVCIAPADYYYGIKDFYQKDKGWDDPHDPPSSKFPILEEITDCCIYELRKFMDLAMKNNPTILEMLWLKDYEYLNPSVGLELVANRDMFLSKRVKHTYAGYGYSQLKKVETHRRWLLNPPLAKPEAKDYGIGEGHLPFTKSEMGSFLEFIMVLVKDSIEFMEPADQLRKLLLEDIDLVTLVKQKPLHRDVIPYIQQMTRASNDYMHLLQSSQAYRTAINEWDSYQQWKRTRNPARAALEAKCGFDSKFAAHSVRLLRQGLECLKYKTLIVDRREAGDAEELLSIRNGDKSYEEVIAITEALFTQLEEAYTTSSLPHHVDQEAIHGLCSELVSTGIDLLHPSLY